MTLNTIFIAVGRGAFRMLTLLLTLEGCHWLRPPMSHINSLQLVLFFDLAIVENLYFQTLELSSF